MRSGNPAMQVFEKPMTWDQIGSPTRAGEGANVERAAPRQMTVSGALNATTILLGICASVAVLAYSYAAQIPGGLRAPLMMGGAFAGLAGGLVLMFKPTIAAFVAPVVAVFQGAFVGLLSNVIAAQFDSPDAPFSSGIVFQAVLLTFGIAAALLIAFRLKVIRLGPTAMKMVAVGTGGIMIFYLASFVLGLIGVQVPMIHQMVGFGQAGWIGIGFSVFVVVMASLNLVMDFQMIEDSAARGAPKYMEWYAGFAILVTLVWLYIEVLRLLSKLRNSD